MCSVYRCAPTVQAVLNLFSRIQCAQLKEALNDTINNDGKYDMIDLLKELGAR